MWGDKKKPCCSCGKGAVLKEGSHFYCPDHYAIFVLGKTMAQIEEELNNDMDI